MTHPTDTTLADSLQDASLLLNANMTEPRLLAAGGGTVSLLSVRSPIKETANEDAAAVIPAGDQAVVLAIADGVGGAASGEEASATVLGCLKQAVCEAVASSDVPGVMIVAEPPPDDVSFPQRPPSLRTAILNGLEESNRQILARGSGAATTVAVVEITGRTIRPYHVGDSMILLTGGQGKIKVQTIPHSPVGYGVEAGLLDGTQAMHHEDRHIVSNVVGCPDMRIEIGPERHLAPRDTLLLASDGLSDNLHVEEIVDRVRKGPLQNAVQSLATEVLGRMRRPIEGRPSKPDDLTLLVYRPRGN